MLYRVVKYSPMVHERGFEATRSEIVATRRAAELLAEQWLPVAYETEYSARMARLTWVDVEPVVRVPGTYGKEYRLCFGKKYHYDTPIHYVPSVGDLGYTP